MLAHRLPRHRKPRAELAQRLAVVGAEPVEQLAAARIGQRLEHLIHEHNMQPFGCMSSDEKYRLGNQSGGRTRRSRGAYWLTRWRMNCCWSVGLLPMPFCSG